MAGGRSSPAMGNHPDTILPRRGWTQPQGFLNMAHSYCACYEHAVVSTKHRRPFLVPENQARIFAYLSKESNPCRGRMVWGVRYPWKASFGRHPWAMNSNRCRGKRFFEAMHSIVILE